MVKIAITRNTVQKSLVLDTVNLLKNHATADEVYDEIVKKHPSVSRGTVYRNLNQLAQNLEIKKIEVPNGADRFDHQAHNHYHARCEKCGKVFDVKMKHLDHLENTINDTDGFEFLRHDIMFSGVCKNCRRENQGSCGEIQPVNI